MAQRLILVLVLLVAALAAPCQLLAADPPFSLPAPEDLRKLKSAIIYTNRGNLYFELLPDEAPWHVANFKYLADKGFYRGLRFHIFKPNYIIQGGAPNLRNRDSGPGYSLPAEFNPEKHVPGALGMARANDFVNPGRRSHGSQFHIILGDSPHMDGLYTVFGRLIRGMRTLEELREGDIIQDVRVFVRQTPPPRRR